jgi:hypothetical protein
VNESPPPKQTTPPPPPLAPRAWKPLEIRLDTDRLYELHVDGKVYERCVLSRHLSGPEHSPTVRRVKDREVIAQVYAAYREQVEKRQGSQSRAAAIASGVAA